MRHTGARGFAWSSAEQVDVFVPRKFFGFFRQIIRLRSNRASNAVGMRIVVTVAANVDKQNLFCILCLQLRGQLGDLYPWNDADEIASPRILDEVRREEILCESPPVFLAPSMKFSCL